MWYSVLPGDTKDLLETPDMKGLKARRLCPVCVLTSLPYNKVDMPTG